MTRPTTLVCVALLVSLPSQAFAQIRLVTPEVRKQLDLLAVQSQSAHPGDPTEAATRFNLAFNAAFGDIFPSYMTLYVDRRLRVQLATPLWAYHTALLERLLRHEPINDVTPTAKVAIEVSALPNVAKPSKVVIQRGGSTPQGFEAVPRSIERIIGGGVEAQTVSADFDPAVFSPGADVRITLITGSGNLTYQLSSEQLAGLH